MKFSTRRKIIKRFWDASIAWDRALHRLFDSGLLREPRKHGVMWAVAMFNFISCPVCLFWRGAVFGIFLGLAGAGAGVWLARLLA